MTEAMVTERVSLSDLSEDPVNANTHPEENRSAIRKSLEKWGQVEPLVVNRRTMTVIGGNGRLSVMEEMGWRECDVHFVDLDDVDATALAIALNRTSELSEWDEVQLNVNLASILTEKRSLLDFTGFRLRDIVSPDPEGEGGEDEPDEPEPEIDRAEELREKWNVELGQLWEIHGHTEHRIACGDCTDAEQVERLMGGERAGLFATDPPYGVAYENDNRPGYRPATTRVANDKLQDEELLGFLTKAFSTSLSVLDENAAWYVWHGQLEQGFVSAQSALSVGVKIHRQIVWVKPQLIFGRGQFHWKHEVAYMGWLEGNTPPDYGLGNGERNQTTVWEVDSVNRSDRKEWNHSTPKPAELFRIPMIKHLKFNEIAYEPFAGSGPQLVAGEQSGRRCYAIELEPKFVAVCLERMSQMGAKCELAK